MPRYETDEILAAAYKGKRAKLDDTLTHVFDTETGSALCGKVNPDSRCGNPANASAVATCPTCAKRDPRGRGEAPRALSHLLQF